MLRTDRKKMAQLAAKFGVEMLVLFGSQARGDAHKSSDVDIAYLAPGGLSLRREAQLAAALSHACHAKDIDLVPLRHMQPLLAYQVAKSGKVLYEGRRSLFNSFSLYAIKLYHESRPLMAMREERLRQRVGA
ncbi:MAG: nucleotidyltransferase domain-containing protein [Candidatus Aenigmarchaeota archaeon]|nr:nucleotidyltransferase domain-containing protein [Candidatus Aenigmarchaeota archaeon]